VVAAIFTLLIGLGGLSASVLLAWRLRRARSYVPVSGRIVERSVGGVLGGSGRASYGPKVKYVYRVDGNEFVNDRYAYFERGYTLKKAKEVLAAVPDDVTVYVSPGDPSQAVIDRSGKGLAVLVGGVGLVIILIAFLIFATQLQVKP
jgi:hypothetical protein